MLVGSLVCRVLFWQSNGERKKKRVIVTACQENLPWLRLPGDALFILGGAIPLVWLCLQALRYPNPRRIEAETELPRTLYTYETELRDMS